MIAACSVDWGLVVYPLTGAVIVFVGYIAPAIAERIRRRKSP